MVIDCVILVTVHSCMFISSLESHTAENIASLLKVCTELTYQMGTRLDSITTDNGANFKPAVQQLLDENVVEENPGCACHIFNFIIKQAIDPSKTQANNNEILISTGTILLIYFAGSKTSNTRLYPTVL